MTKFTSRVDRLDNGIRAHVIPVPPEVAEKFADAKRVFVKIGSEQLDRAIQGKKSGSPYIGVGKKVLDDLGLRLGSKVEVRLTANKRPDEIPIAAEFLEVLKQDSETRARWETFTPGKQRSLNHFVITAKREDTRIRRAVELAEKIRTYTLHDD